MSDLLFTCILGGVVYSLMTLGVAVGTFHKIKKKSEVPRAMLRAASWPAIAVAAPFRAVYKWYDGLEDTMDTEKKKERIGTNSTGPR